jgi:hypothetical protein
VFSAAQFGVDFDIDQNFSFSRSQSFTLTSARRL